MDGRSAPVARQQRPDRVVAEQGGEQRADRRQVRAIVVAAASGTRWARSPAVKAGGSMAASPMIISEKKMPIDSDMPAFWNVDRLPDAAPRWRAGTLRVVLDKATHL